MGAFAECVFIAIFQENASTAFEQLFFLNHETGCTDPAGTLSIEEFRLEFLKIRTFSPSFRLGFSSGLRKMCSAVWFEVNQIAAKLFVLCTSHVT